MRPRDCPCWRAEEAGNDVSPSDFLKREENLFASMKDSGADVSFVALATTCSRDDLFVSRYRVTCRTTGGNPASTWL